MHSIFVGRKGTGKSATFYKLQDELGSDPRNHICVIKPVAYELEGVMQMLTQTLASADRGYLVESLWKFLVSTELAKSLFIQLTAKTAVLPAAPLQSARLPSFIEQKLIMDNARILNPTRSRR